MRSGYYRKNPVTLQAWQYPGPGFVLLEAPLWVQENWLGAIFPSDGAGDINLYIAHPRHGPLTVAPTDWVIYGAADDIYPCADTTFQKIYVSADKVDTPAIPITPVAGYRQLSATDIAFMNRLKVDEEAVLRRLDTLASLPGTDGRWFAIARTHIQQGFMAASRAIAQPQRLTDDAVKALGYSI